ncbi:MAG: alpha/beta hydrolase [Planctomycetaceae bacterium]|nr:alpha/beta hydrolase [Planctomycetaceae bacterium]
MRIVCVTLAFVLGLLSQVECAQAQTSKDSARLKKLLERYPEADTNKDGELTVKEANAFVKQNAVNRRQQGGTPAKAPEGGEIHIYKKVGEIELPLYVFKPDQHKPQAKKPAIVFFFGGGWKAGNPSQFEHHCKHLASRGMVAITVEYRVSSRHAVKVEDCIEDAKSAMRWVRGNAQKLGVDPNRIASGGGSAGGHLAACTAVIDDFNAAADDLDVSAKPNAMVLFNPYMGNDAGTEKSDRTRGPANKTVPYTYASKEQPPCIMFFGTADRLLEGAELYQKKSEEAGNRSKIVTYNDQGHGFFNYGRSGNKYYKLTLAEADQFLVDLGWLPASSRPQK